MTELAIGVQMLNVFNKEQEVLKLAKWRGWVRISCLTLIFSTLATIVTFSCVFKADFQTIDSQSNNESG
jgi:hypothetical protein